MALTHDDGTACPGSSCLLWNTGQHVRLLQAAVNNARREREALLTKQLATKRHS